MKNIALVILVFVAAFAQAQTVEYSLDTLRRDKFFLIETRSDKKAQKNQQIEITRQQFGDTAQVSLYVKNLKKDAKAYRDQSDLLTGKAKAIQKLMDRSPWFKKPKPIKKRKKSTNKI